MTNKITFIAINEFAYKIAQKPYPSSSNIPNWWKSMPKYCDEQLNKEQDGKQIFSSNRKQW